MGACREGWPSVLTVAACFRICFGVYRMEFGCAVSFVEDLEAAKPRKVMGYGIMSFSHCLFAFALVPTFASREKGRGCFHRRPMLPVVAVASLYYVLPPLCPFVDLPTLLTVCEIAAI